MSTVLALVRVLELLYVQDYRSLITDDGVHRLPSAASERHYAARPHPTLTIHTYQFLGFKLDVESASALRTMPKELHY
jgi:hypothetical protein